jgi:hypothetical protein
MKTPKYYFIEHQRILEMRRYFSDSADRISTLYEKYRKPNMCIFEYQGILV